MKIQTKIKKNDHSKPQTSKHTKRKVQDIHDKKPKCTFKEICDKNNNNHHQSEACLRARHAALRVRVRRATQRRAAQTHAATAHRCEAT